MALNFSAFTNTVDEEKKSLNFDAFKSNSSNNINLDLSAFEGNSKPLSLKPTPSLFGGISTQTAQSTESVYTGPIIPVRTSFAKEPIINFPGGPGIQLGAEMAFRLPELPFLAAAFFQKNLKDLITGEAKTSFFQEKGGQPLQSVLGIDPARLGLKEEDLQNTIRKTFNEVRNQEKNNPSIINGKQDYVKSTLNVSKAVAKTFLPDVMDAVFGADLGIQFGKIGVGILKTTAKQLPESLLFKIQTNNISPQAIRDVLIGGSQKSTPEEFKIANDFIKNLSSSERSSLFSLAKSYEEAGLSTIPIETTGKPTILGKFAGATEPKPTLPPRISGLLTGEIRPSGGQAGFIDLPAMGEELGNLARQAKNIDEFKQVLSKDNLTSLAAKGTTAEVFFTAIKGLPELPKVFKLEKNLLDSSIGKLEVIEGMPTIGKKSGFGLAKIRGDHPEVLPFLEEGLKNAKIVEKLPQRTILESDIQGTKLRIIVDHQLGKEPKTFLNNAYFVPQEGIEPPTPTASRLRSTNELLRQEPISIVAKTEQAVNIPKELQPISKPNSLTKITYEDLPKIAETIKKYDIKKEITDQEFTNLQTAVEAMEEQLLIDPAADLVKYINPETGSLPEILGLTKQEFRQKYENTSELPAKLNRPTKRNTRIWEFIRRGDSIIQEIMGAGRTYEEAPDLNTAQDAVDKFIKARDQLKEIRTRMTEIRKERALVGKGERLMQLARKDRRSAFRAIKSFFNLTETELAEIRGRTDIMAMTQNKFEDFLQKAGEKAQMNEERRDARIQLEATIFGKELKKFDNLRRAMKFPEISKMTTEQLNQFDEVLSQYKDADEFLTQRQIETIDRTKLKGLRTIREVQEFLASQYNLTPAQLPGIKPHPFMYDAQLARQHPLFDLLVDEYNLSYLKATGRIIELEKEMDQLLNAARASRSRGIVEKLIPTDEKIIDWLQKPEIRIELEAQMTSQELKAAQRMDEIFSDYYGWLAKRAADKKFASRFEDKYYPHVRRGFLEAWKEDGFLKAVKEAKDQFVQEEARLTILDEKTGDILPYEKWVGFSQFRSGNLIPTKNAASAFKAYITSLEKARQFDEFIPEVMIYVHSLSPRELTPRGLEENDSLQRFIKSWINSKKGRVTKQMVTPGSKLDWTLRMATALVRFRDLGLNIPVGIANIFGEQAGNLTMLRTAYPKGVIRLATPKGRAITEKYENFVGKSLWNKLQETSNNAGDQLLSGIFGLFSAANRRGNQIFLLGAMTDAEYASGEISLERLAQLRKKMGKYRSVEGAESIVGKSAEAAVGLQYKKWAIPILTSTKDNILKLIELGKTKGMKVALSSEEGAELFFSIGLGFILGGGIMGYYNELKDKKDRNFVEDLIYKSIRDGLSMIGVLSPIFLGSFAVPRLASFLQDLGTAIDNLIMLERLKTTGELRGVKELENILTPVALKSLFPEEKEIKKTGLSGLPQLPKLPKLPSLKI